MWCGMMLCVLSALTCLGSPVLLVRLDGGVSERGGQCNGIVVSMVCVGTPCGTIECRPSCGMYDHPLFILEK